MPFSCDPLWEQHNDHRYRTPVDLALTAPKVERVLVIGSCFSEGISPYLNRAIPSAAFDHIEYRSVICWLERLSGPLQPALRAPTQRVVVP